jgi:molybdate transport system substrate-binding protein
MRDLLQASVRFISIANPETAPYGAAAMQALQKESLWEPLQPKIVRADNVNAAKQMAETGNADVGFTALSLVLNAPGEIILIEESLHSPIHQAIGIVAASPRRASAERFLQYVLREGGPEILKRHGYEPPAPP